MRQKIRLAPFVVCWLLAAQIGAARSEDWTGWRGPTRQGNSTEKGLPTRWGAKENVAWKTAIPGEGWSSSIVTGDRVFVTATTEDGASCHLICLDRKTGAIAWDKEVLRQKPDTKHERNSHATPTPVTDGERVYVVFSSGGIVAVSLEGEVLWKNQDNHFRGVHGCGASPILSDDLLIFPFDTTSDGPNKALGHTEPWERSFILALDKMTGKERWKASRGRSRVSHSSPQILKNDKRLVLVSAAGDVVQGHDLETGKRLWSASSKGEGVVPSAVTVGGLIFTGSGFGDSAICEVRPGAEGNAEVVWRVKKAVPMVSSFLYVNGYLFTVNENGIAQCLKADSGEVKWQERLGGSYYASPVYADGKIYFLSEQGETVVIAAEPRFKVTARNSLRETCRASLAVSNKHLFIRSEKHLYCIGRPAK
jgi:outer membrane protein assembly factor BamB